VNAQSGPPVTPTGNYLDAVQAGILTSAGILLGRGYSTDAVAARLSRLYPAANSESIDMAINNRLAGFNAAAQLDQSQRFLPVDPNVIPVNELLPADIFQLSVIAGGLNTETGRQVQRLVELQFTHPPSLQDALDAMSDMGWREVTPAAPAETKHVPSSSFWEGIPPDWSDSPKIQELISKLFFVFSVLQQGPQ
jgi:hypothetical protein